MRLFIFFFFLSFFSFAQVTFDKGYFVNNKDQRVDCFIKNEDRYNNPSEFIYRLSESGEERKLSAKDAKTVEIYDYSKFISSTVLIDRSSEKTDRLSPLRAPEFKEETLFLKVLVEGNANLYLLKNSNLERFFFQVKDAGINQLVYKAYLNNDNQVSYNNQYKMQLWQQVNNLNKPMSYFESIDYKEEDLVNHFELFNGKRQNAMSSQDNINRKVKLFLAPKIGVVYNELSVRNPNDEVVDFNKDFTLNFSGEFESIFPINRYKWSFFSEFGYYSFKDTVIIENPRSVSDDDYTIDYSTLNISLGLRHYLYINQDSRIFLSALYMFNLTSNSKFSSDKFNANRNLESNGGFALALGYKYKNLGIEVRRQSKDLGSAISGSWDSSYNRTFLLLSYAIQIK